MLGIDLNRIFLKNRLVGSNSKRKVLKHPCGIWCLNIISSKFFHESINFQQLASSSDILYQTTDKDKIAELTRREFMILLSERQNSYCHIWFTRNERKIILFLLFLYALSLQDMDSHGSPQCLPLYYPPTFCSTIHLKKIVS